MDPFPDPVVPVGPFQVPKEDIEDYLGISGQHLYLKLKVTLQWNDIGEVLTEDN